MNGTLLGPQTLRSQNVEVSKILKPVVRWNG